PLLLHPASSDILTDRLSNYVNVSVNPCDDFYQHVCSQSANVTEFPLAKISRFYEKIGEKFRNFSRSRNLAIMNDYSKRDSTNAKHKPVFSRDHFEKLVRSRSQNNDACYRGEFEHFSHFYIETTDE
ncbi:hypothetical protein PENTCL1PPCAC_29063, partial [Pristionchus entomophagus]